MKRIPILIFCLGLLLIIGSTILAFFDFGTGATFSRGSNFSAFYVVGSFLSASLLINLKLKNMQQSYLYGLGYPIILALSLNMYSKFYLSPKIDQEGILINGTITGSVKRISGDATLKTSYNYEYMVDNRTYFKFTFDDSLEVGDTIFIKYLSSNPDLHKFYNVKP